MNDAVEVGSHAAGTGSQFAVGSSAPTKGLPWNILTLFLAGIFTILAFAVLYVSGSIAVPIICAFLLNLLLQPAMKLLVGLRIPKSIAAVLLILVFLGGLGLVCVTISTPAAEWISKGPEGLTKLQDRISSLMSPIEAVRQVSKEVDIIATGSDAAAAAPASTALGVSTMLFSGTRAIATGLGTLVLLLFFLLVTGDLFLRRLVEVLPTLSNKKQAVDIAREIERNISTYLVTITMMNAGVGVATGILTYLCGVPNPSLWGAMAFALNYLLILGPLGLMVILFLVGLVTFDTFTQAMVPVVGYLVIHIVEGAVTPMLVARKFELNPVIVIISLVFWYWMWGISGALVSVPLLTSFKIVCDRIESLMPLGHFLGGEGGNGA